MPDENDESKELPSFEDVMEGVELPPPEVTEDEAADDGKKKQPKTKREKPEVLGNVKLIGIAGLVKEAQFSIEKGQSVLVGRSSECEICLHDVPKAKALDDNEELEKHFRTVSRKHMRVTYQAADKIIIEDLSSNGLFLDGKRVDGTVTITDIVHKPHELKLGTTETFCLDWWKLVPKSSVKMVQVMVKRETTEEDEEDGDEKPKRGTSRLGDDKA